jgi:hypothetical protein
MRIALEDSASKEEIAGLGILGHVVEGIVVSEGPRSLVAQVWQRRRPSILLYRHLSADRGDLAT